MKAAVYEESGKVVVRDVPEPTLEDGEVLLEIEACCLCGAEEAMAGLFDSRCVVLYNNRFMGQIVCYHNGYIV